ARLRAAGRIVGVGLSAFVEYTGMGSETFLRRGMREVRGDDSAAVKVDGSGGVRAYVSTPSQGQGHETVFAQLVGETLGLSPEDVEVVPVDTASVPVGTGTFASRAMIAGGGALLQAAAGVRSKALQIAARSSIPASSTVRFTAAWHRGLGRRCWNRWYTMRRVSRSRPRS